MNAALPFRAALLALALLICLPFAGINAAQAATLIHNAWGTNNSVVCTGYDALQFNATRNPGQGGPPFAGNTLLMLADVTYWYPNYPCYESTTWTSNGAGRKAAKVSGAYMNPNPTSLDDIYLPIDRFIKLRNLTIDDVDLDYDNMALWFALPDLTPQNIALTLNNGSLTGLNPPSFNVLAPLTLTASGDSTLSNWGKGPVSPQTTLNVTPGSTLTFFRLGQFAGGTIATDSWYFSHPDNVATIDGGTLHLDQSFVTFGKSVFVPGEEPGRMTFQNSALLDITGEGGRLDSGNFFFLNSRLNLGSANRLKAIDTVTINGTTVTTDDSSKLDTAALNVVGTNTFALGKDPSAGNYIATTGAMVMQPGASLTLNGQGSLAVTQGLDYTSPATGQIVINDRATLVNTGALFNIRPSSPITINRTSAAVSGALLATNGGSLVLRASAGNPGQVTNHGEIIVDADSTLQAVGPVIIQGGSEGLLDIGSAGALMIGNVGTALAATESLTTNNLVELDNFSTLQLTLDPTALKNGQLRAGSTLGIAPFAELHLALVNDQVLPDGTRFTLIDYGAFAYSQHFFNGHANGSTFVLGLNHYRINYADTPDPGYNGAITLTVVAPLPPVSLSPATQTVTGTVGVPLTQTAAMIPSGFVGTVTYTISPGLPNGLTFNHATGAIFGVPAEALTTTVFTIRGAGATSGTATATVNLTIGVASQTISFGPAPSPTYAPGGGFQVFASASSGLPVSYSSLTPVVCDAHGSTILMLGAGTCTIAANQPGNSSYSPAPQVAQTITIAKATPKPLTLSAVPPNINVGETSALSISGGSGTGAISYTATGSGTCTISGNTLTGTADGTCTVTATQAADPNYLAVTSNPVAINVGGTPQAALVLTASPATISVNATSTLTVTGGSGGGPVTYALNSGPCTLAGNLLTATGVGQCQATATKAAEGVYGAATSNPVTVTISRLTAPALVLSATPTSVGFGGSSTLSTTGGIPGAAVSYSVSGPCSVDGNVLLGVSAGICVVTAHQAETNIYNSVTSNAAPVTVKERATTFSYPQGAATTGRPFTLTPTTSGFTQPTFALLYGNLPAGLTLNPATGVISGTPTGPAGTFDGVISAHENNAYDAALAVITVQTDPTDIPTLSEWGMLLLGLMLAGIAWQRQRRLG